MGSVLAISAPEAGAGSPPETHPFGVEKAFADQAATLQDLLDTMARHLENGVSVAAEQSALGSGTDALLELDSALRERFAATEKKLLDAGLPDLILERHRRTVADHEKNLAVLLGKLAAVEGAGHSRTATPAKLNDAVRAARKYLQKHRAKDAPRFLSGSPLPLQPANRKAEVRDISEARAEAAAQRAVPRLSLPPVEADLAATVDVQITPEVEALATELHNSPLEMYRHVRDNFRFEPYMGSRKGSRETFLVSGGNDYDIASALIALLRASDIPARYVSGAVLMPIDQVMNWVGVTDPQTAASILATAGMQGTAYTDGADIVAIGFLHVWVAAYLPYGNYRGTGNDGTGNAWVPLDPSFKEYGYSAATNIPAEMGFDADAFIDDYISTFHTPSPVELYLQQLEAFTTSEHPELVFPDDVFRTSTITPDDSGILPASLPFEQLAAATEYATVPANKRHQVRFHIRNGATTLLDHTLDLPTIASRRITISYDAASPADQAVIDSFGDLYSTPPNLVALKPVLRVEGVAVATGASIGAGLQHSSDMYFLTPAGEGNPLPVVQNAITAGTYQGIGIDTWRVATEALTPPAGEALPDTDGLTGEKLYRTAMTYLDRVDQSGQAVAQTTQMVVSTAVSEAIVENVVLVSYSFSTPVAWEWRGLVVDADRKIIGPFAVDGDDTKEKPYFVLTGADASISENRIFEDLFGEQAVSTIKILELASDLDVQICTIVTSIVADCPTLSQPAAVVNAINAALAQGHEVTIPRTPITYFEWSGTGYIDMDPATGAAGYIISGGQNGGATVDSWQSGWRLFFAVYGKDVCNIIAIILSPEPNSFFPFPGPGSLTRQPSAFEVDYTVYYCEEEDGEVTISETYRPHFQYPPGQFVFHAGWGTNAMLPFTVFDVEILGDASDSYMARGYTGAPVAGDPDQAKIKYVIRPSGFTPKMVQLKFAQASEIRLMTLPNLSGMQEALFDGKNNGGTYIADGAYDARIIVTAPDDASDRSADHTLSVVEVTNVAILDTGGGALTTNAHPVKPGGSRVFAGRLTKAAVDRGDRVKIRATLSTAVPPGKLKVHLKSFDVVDPTGLIDDNHGSAAGTPNEGTLSNEDPPTTGENTVWVDFTVTMQPGDNFKVFASTNKKMMDNLTDATVEAHTDAEGVTSNSRLGPLASDRLTVWRRVHVERDSMGPVAGNVLAGDITAVTNNGDGTSTVTTNSNLTEDPTAAGRFAGGILTSGGKTFRVSSNTQGPGLKATVTNGAMAAVPVVGPFKMVDDDDFNGNDGTGQDGDAGEDVSPPDISKMQDDDDPAKNVYAYAYIRPTYDIGDTNNAVPFVLNTPDGADEKSALLGTYDFDAVALEADDDFWTVYLLAAYQMQTEEDGDLGGNSTTFGQVEELNGQGASVFLEAIHESNGPACSAPHVSTHEVGHLFKGMHTDGDLMSGGGCNVLPLTFHDLSLERMRNLLHP